MIKLQSEISLADNDLARYRGIAFDGCQFFLTKRGAREIVRLDHCFAQIECIPVRRCYAYLCYDPCLCCYWASDDECPSMLFQLDLCFHEVDCIRIQCPKTCETIGVITGISFDCCKNCLLLSSSVGLIWVSIDACGTIIDYHPLIHPWITGVINAGNCNLFCCVSEGRQVIRVTSDCEKSKKIGLIPTGIWVEAAVFGRCADPKKGCCLYVLGTKRGCYPTLLECVLDPLHFDVGCCCPCCPKPPSPPAQHPCGDLLESVALMEAALSHILNAQGEKLQKVIACTDDPCVLLKVNEAINRMVVNATFLEQVLYQKLEIAKEICDPCNPK